MDEKTERLLRELAEKLGTTAEHLWSVLVRQAHIAAWWNVASFVLLVTIAAVAGYLIASVRKKYDDDWPWTGPGATLIAIFLICLFMIMVLLADGSTTLAGFFNPEYWALKQIVK